LKDSLVEKEDIIEELKNFITDLNIGKGVIKNKNKGKVKEIVFPSIKKDVGEAPFRASTYFLTLPPEIDPDNRECSSSRYCSTK
ncbi:hypothetical protein B0H65DRAFT_435143, partial [Neurospora tetraspora]